MNKDGFNKHLGTVLSDNVQTDYYTKQENKSVSINETPDLSIEVLQVTTIKRQPIKFKPVSINTDINTYTETGKVIDGMKVEYAPNFGIDINEITLKKEQLKSALQLLNDNHSQVGRVILNIDKKKVYIYHETCSGYKKPSQKYIDDYDQAMSIACSYTKGQKRTQNFKSLEKQILKLLKK